jgi:putative ABC transport system permease protein
MLLAYPRETFDMLKSYFIIALRNLKKNPSFSVINIAGLAVGLAVCLLITLFVFDELSYDKYNDNAGRIYRINSDNRFNGSIFNSADVSPIVGPTLVKEYPSIEAAVRFIGNEDVIVKKGHSAIVEHHATFADSTLFKVFTLPLLDGDPATALAQPNTMVISETTARKYFGNTDVVGHTLLLNNQVEYKITGVMKDMPAQSHMHFTIIRAMTALENSRDNSWLGSSDYVTYLLTRPGTSAGDLSKVLDEAVQHHVAPLVQSMLHSTLREMGQKGDYIRYTFFPLTKIHLYANLKDELEPNGNIEYVYIFTVVAGLILLVACINFINLSIARSARRAREVGIRKVLGSIRSGLVWQFLVESIVTCLVAVLLAIGLSLVALPWFNELAGKSIAPSFLLNKWAFPVLIGITLVLGLLAGSYPAFLLSSFQPIRVLKGKFSVGFRTGWLKNGLIIFQCVTAIGLIIGTVVIYSQLSYIRDRNIGYNREQVLVLPNTYVLDNHARVFRDEVLRMQGVLNGTMTRNLPTSGNNNIQGFSKQPDFSVSQSISMGNWQVDENYIPTFQMQLSKGRNFSPAFKTDSTGMIINETAAALLGYKDPLDGKLYQLQNDKIITYHIIGVVKDFNFNSLRQKIGPICFLLSEQRGSMAFRIGGKNIPTLLSRVESLYKSYDHTGGLPFLYSFMDKDFNQQYRAEQRTGHIFICFAIFAIFIACLGLFGLVAYAADQRTREIGIRKVLGASVGNIVGILSNDFLRLVGMAAIIALPAGWWLMDNWLRDFAYRTTIHWWVFFIAGGLAFLVTLLTVGIQAIQAANANPAKSLRTD